MIEIVPGMPSGTYGFRVLGDVTAQDYRDVILPPLRATIDAGEKLRILVAVGPFHEGPDAIWEHLTVDIELGVRHREAWAREAVVSDIGWVRRATGLFSWMMPGEVRAFAEDDIEGAKAWLIA